MVNVTLMKPNRPQPSACMMKVYIDAASFKILLNYIVTSLRFYSAVIEVARSVVPGVSCIRSWPAYPGKSMINYCAYVLFDRL